MKKIIFLFIPLIMALFCSLSFSQGWNSIVTTTISAVNLEKMDLFTNKDGNHALIKRNNGNIVYYSFNSSGTVNNNKTVTLETNGDFPNIIGSIDRVYAIYKAGNYIKGKYSTNGGSSWSNITNVDINPYTVNGVDAVYEQDYGVHLVWATQDNGSDFETYYYRLRPSDHVWVDFKNVTDYNASEVGGFPTVSFSTNRVHISYNNGQGSIPDYIQGELKTRDKLNTSWQTPQSADTSGNLTKVYPYGNNLYNFYTEIYVDGYIYVGLHVKSRSLSGTSWPTFDTYLNSDIYHGYVPHPVTTSNGIMHIIYYDSYLLFYTNYNGSGWSSIQTIGNSYGGISPAIFSVSNDLFVVMLSAENVLYRQYDATPLAPTNLAVSSSVNYHPYLTWNRNPEPDLNHYVVEKYVSQDQGWINLGQTSNLYFEDQSESYCHVPPPQLCPAGHTVYYRIKAIDVQSHISNASNSIGTVVQGGLPYKIV